MKMCLVSNRKEAGDTGGGVAWSLGFDAAVARVLEARRLLPLTGGAATHSLCMVG
jgi:hypothetical protein